MDKTIVGLIAALGAIAPVATLAAVTPDQVDRAMNAGSFAELLQSVPNAVAILNAAQEQATATTKGGEVQVAQWHHHHHHHFWHHHHHHHHHCGWWHHHHHCWW